MNQKLSDIAYQAIQNVVFPGCVIGVVHKTGEREIFNFGSFTYKENFSKTKKDSIFDVASLTKSFVTASVGLKLLEQKKINLENQIIQYLPEFQTNFREEVRIKHLFTHTLDFNFHLSKYKERDSQDIMKAIFTYKFQNKPGSRYCYVNSTSIVFAKLIEKVTSQSLDKLSNTYFFQPLEMRRTGYFPLKRFNKNEIIPTEINPCRGKEIQGEVHDESAYVLEKIGAQGHAGLFSTAPDVLNFLEMLLNEGKYKGKKIFQPVTVRQMHKNQIHEIKACSGLGWELNQPKWMGQSVSRKAFGKTGFTGCSCLVDPVKEIGLVILSNMTYPDRHVGLDAKNRFRREIADIVFKR